MDKSTEEIEAKYLEDSSSFMNIDGVNIHTLMKAQGLSFYCYMPTTRT